MEEMSARTKGAPSEPGLEGWKGFKDYSPSPLILNGYLPHVILNAAKRSEESPPLYLEIPRSARNDMGAPLGMT